MTWRYVIGSLVGIAIIATGIGLYHDYESYKNQSRYRHWPIEISNSSWQGFLPSGQLSWSLHVGRVFANDEISQNTGDSVDSGTFYSETGRPMITNLVAAKMNLDTQSQTLMTSSVGFDIPIPASNRKKSPESSATTSAPPPIQVTADTLSHRAATNETILVGNVVIRYQKSTITTNEMVMNHEKNIAVINSGFSFIYDTKMSIRGKKMVIDFTQNTAKMGGNLMGRIQPSLPTSSSGIDPRESRFRKLPTTIVADTVIYTATEGQETIMATGNVRIHNSELLVKCPAAVFNRTADSAQFTGPVKIFLKSLQSFVPENRLKTLQNSDIRTAIRTATTCQSKSATLDVNTHTISLVGAVVITQNALIVRCGRAVYTDSPALITLEDSVNFKKKNGNSLTCSRVTIDLVSEEIRATSKIHGEFKLNRRLPSEN